MSLEFVSFLDNDGCIRRHVYLVDIFEQLNKLNLIMRGKNTNIILFKDTCAAFISKFDN